MNSNELMNSARIIARWAVDARSKREWDAFNAYVNTLDLLVGSLQTSKLIEEAMKTA